ncbi:MAG: hypothetical protein NC822_02905 [Candidatus Omnitrophica bacterium]|nr:hypothetical protein [Candidatus Omnitrophota bacterium]MCM8827376.1 hypothetical protein [Candidatus Omnitrophota bacterium]
MSLICGITLDDRFIFFSFVSFKEGKFTLQRETQLELNSGYSDLEDFIKIYIEDIDREIRNTENKYSFKTESIFLGIPCDFIQSKVVEDLVPLGINREKKITPQDIISAKKQIENIFLDWQDYPLHNLVYHYEIEGRKFNTPPIGILAKRLKIKSLLIFTKSKLVEQFESAFDNFNRNFRGFIYDALCDLASGFDGKEESALLSIRIGYKKTRVSYFLNLQLVKDRIFDFGEEEIIRNLSKELSVSEDTAYRLIFYYSSFRNIFSSKEINIKDGDKYINLASYSLNNFLKEKTKESLEKIIFDLKQEIEISALTVNFLGRFTNIDGFSDFIKDTFSLNLKSSFNKSFSPSFGCVRYGVTRFLETLPRSTSLIRNIFKIYKDYF